MYLCSYNTTLARVRRIWLSLILFSCQQADCLLNMLGNFLSLPTRVCLKASQTPRAGLLWADSMLLLEISRSLLADCARLSRTPWLLVESQMTIKLKSPVSSRAQTLMRQIWIRERGAYLTVTWKTNATFFHHVAHSLQLSADFVHYTTQMFDRIYDNK